ncbi:uncharacterized, partial [Tachysurus ichikawai]
TETSTRLAASSEVIPLLLVSAYTGRHVRHGLYSLLIG